MPSATFYDFDSPAFQQWLDDAGLRRRAGEPDLAFARRAHRAIATDFDYESRSDGDRRASAVAAAGKSDCGGLSVLFVSTLRANGVPARSLQGRWARDGEHGRMVGDIPFLQQHVKSEFFSEG